MPTDIQALLAEVTARHFPNPPASPAQLAAFEARAGWRLDDDLRAFYSHCDGATFFRAFPHETYRVLRLHEIQPASMELRRDASVPASWWTLVYLGDSDFNLVDVARGGPFPILDAYHETFPQQVVQIAPSFATWLERTLRSGNQLWWLPASD